MKHLRLLMVYNNPGLFTAPLPIKEQEHALLVVADLYLNPNLKINMGPGIGLAGNSDPFLFKLLAGRRINWTRIK